MQPINLDQLVTVTGGMDFQRIASESMAGGFRGAVLGGAGGAIAGATLGATMAGVGVIPGVVTVGALGAAIGGVGGMYKGAVSEFQRQRHNGG